VALSVSAEQIAWDVSSPHAASADLLPIMRTDVSLRSINKTIIIDAKYYGQTLQSHREHESVRSGHLYQLFAYIKNLERNGGPDATAEGILLYPKVQRDVDFRSVIQGHPLRAKTIDLMQPWGAIRRELLSLAV
jgi:5-methylcytosine-specific restriction enzyme subunit McrC